MTYQDADMLLQGRCKNQRRIANNTWLSRKGDVLTVRLYKTELLRFYKDGTVQVRSGGINSYAITIPQTTKNRLNKYLPLGWRVRSDWRLFGNAIVLSKANEGDQAMVPSDAQVADRPELEVRIDTTNSVSQEAVAELHQLMKQCKACKAQNKAFAWLNR